MKEMTQEELNLHITEASNAIGALMSSLSMSEDKKNKKKARLLGHWIKKYVTLLKREMSFDSKSLPRYKRGQILSIDFGFRVGNEFGGLHYAVVIDTRNSMSSTIVTVIPLMSLKNGHKDSKYMIALTDGVMLPVEEKMNHLIKQAMIFSEEAEKEGISPAEVKAKKDVAKTLTANARRTLDELTQLKMGTVANICQITTVSKMRIEQPRNTSDPLFNVSLSDTDMKIIDKAVNGLYGFDR